MPQPEQRYVLGVAYQAGRDPRIKRGADGGRDFFSKEELEKAAWGFLPKGATVGLFHADATEGSATVVESYIYRGPDWDLGNDVVVKSGDWLLGAILDERAWQLYKSGQITGWSPQGSARRITPRSS
ncbi:XkdF-like putative serine protease domain-containing protein [Streptomyces sp. NPDC058299]|uniref:XkdF-like putative serine protease domain-containing protein n=1 Tax=Streptomyces sp. NPDC058299 TaxID=3346435 RepID=UPI0036EE375E